MKRITATALLAIANSAMAGHIISRPKAVQAEVPFDFAVGNNLLPLGTYMTKEESTGLIVTKSHDKARSQPTLGLVAA